MDLTIYNLSGEVDIVNGQVISDAGFVRSLEILENPGLLFSSRKTLVNPVFQKLSLKNTEKLKNRPGYEIIPKLFNTIQKERLNKRFLCYIQYGRNISTGI